ncbi:hypothetical protein [Priestia endophytica]|uniref:hypothetical protein n=1 Tax=Priestia endophytica TaxID=135735 RepID=UPI002E1F055E|nr:hypothetical protein [Priestia endophytica]
MQKIDSATENVEESIAAQRSVLENLKAEKYGDREHIKYISQSREAFDKEYESIEEGEAELYV